MTTRSLIVSLIAAAGICPVSATAASTAETAPSLQVSYSDLDLGAEAGRKALSKRIHGAAKQVCGTPPSRELRMLVANLQCRENARSSADLQVERLLATRLAATNRTVEVSGTH